MLIRAATPSDVEGMVSLLTTLFSIESDFTPDAERQARGLRQLLGAGAVVLVGEQDGVLIGMVTLQFVISTAEGGPSAWLEDMVVAASWRGQGVGRQLLATAAKAAASRGCTRIQLMADDGNGPALAFYRRGGWEETQLRVWRRSP